MWMGKLKSRLFAYQEEYKFERFLVSKMKSDKLNLLAKKIISLPSKIQIHTPILISKSQVDKLTKASLRKRQSRCRVRHQCHLLWKTKTLKISSRIHSRMSQRPLHLQELLEWAHQDKDHLHKNNRISPLAGQYDSLQRKKSIKLTLQSQTKDSMTTEITLRYHCLLKAKLLADL